MAIVQNGCASNPAQHIGKFEGTWAGKNDFGLRLEARIEGVDANGRIVGAGCWRSSSGMIRGGLIDEVAKMSPTGRTITAQFGSASFTVESRSNGEVILYERRTRKDGRSKTIKTELKPTEAPVCAHRLLRTPREIETIEAGESITGQWTGTWDSGSIAEPPDVNVNGDTGSINGRACSRTTDIDRVTIHDLGDRDPVFHTYDAEEASLTIESQAAPGRWHQQRYTLIDANTLKFEATSDLWSEQEKTETLAMDRGTHPEGCLRYTTDM